MLAILTIAQAKDWAELLALLSGACVIALAFVRGGGGKALGILQEANRVLTHRVGELETKDRASQVQIAQLQAKTDVSIQIQPLLRWTEQHEQHEQQRFEATLKVLDLIATKLGAEVP